MKELLSAFQFLTIIPIKIKELSEKQIASAMIYFPFVGLCLGMLLYCVYLILIMLKLPGFAINTIIVVVLIAITGGMHLDGLADTADAFLSGKPKEKMLEIMRDSHIGAMGVISLVSVILLKIVLLCSLPAGAIIPGLILMCVLSRWSAVFLMFLFPYARKEGKAGVFIKGNSLLIFSLATFFAFLFSFIAWQIKGLILLFAVAGCAYLAGKISTRKIDGLTGDTLGGIIEISELIVLFAVCIS